MKAPVVDASPIRDTASQLSQGVIDIVPKVDGTLQPLPGPHEGTTRTKLLRPPLEIPILKLGFDEEGPRAPARHAQQKRSACHHM